MWNIQKPMKNSKIDYGFEISIAMISGDWYSDDAHKIPIIDVIRNHNMWDAVNVEMIRPKTIVATLM